MRTGLPRATRGSRRHSASDARVRTHVTRLAWGNESGRRWIGQACSSRRPSRQPGASCSVRAVPARGSVHRHVALRALRAPTPRRRTGRRLSTCPCSPRNAFPLAGRASQQVKPRHTHIKRCSRSYPRVDPDATEPKPALPPSPWPWSRVLSTGGEASGRPLTGSREDDLGADGHTWALITRHSPTAPAGPRSARDA